MELRFLGNSGLGVSALAFGTMTFGGKGHFRQVGSVQVDAARRHVDLCLDAGVNLFDTADVVGARTEEKLKDNLNVASWEMTEEEVRRLDEVSATPPIYPYWHQQRFNSERVPQSIGTGASG